MSDRVVAHSAEGKGGSHPRVRERPKVIYVMGAGYSGSTILGVALGNCEEVFFGGEILEWTLRSGEPLLGGLERTRFWRSVREQVGDASDLFGPLARECLERSSAVLRVDRWPARRRLRRRYRQVAGELFGAIARVAGVTHIVDTSHFPLRARELQRVEGIELYLIFLVRNPQSVVASYASHINRHDIGQRARQVLAKNVDLWLTYLLSVATFLRQPCERRLLVHHEDFIADPDGTLRTVLDQVGCAAAVPDLSSLSTGFALQGNRLLWSDVVSVNSKPRQPARGSRVTSVLQLPWKIILPRLKPTATALARRERPVSASN